MPSPVARFEIDAFGWFPPGHVRARVTQTPRATTPELEALIAETWERVQAQCRASGAILYNGRLWRWIDHAVEDGRLWLTVGPTCYRDFVGTNLHNRHRIREFGRAMFSNPIGTTATIISADGWLLYGRRSHRVAYHAGHLHTFGGALEAADQAKDGSIDPFAAVRRELAEELGLAAHEITGLGSVGLIHDHEIWQPELLFEATVTLERDALLDRLVHDAEQEHTGIEAVRDEPDALVPFMRQAAPVAPVAVGAICLHGRHRWGKAWYDQAFTALS
jgi:8-oxo-dGTP pyrophosphatase MutT (NUDIX family)